MIWMTPAQLHINLEVMFSAGMPPRSIVGDPGAQGAVVIGMHGIGVSTPMAAEVAAATIGLAMLMHIPNGRMFTMGLLSMMLADGMVDDIDLFSGRTTRLLGAIPKMHMSCAPLHT